MKKTLTIAALAATMGALSASAQDSLIAGWDAFDSTAAPTATVTGAGFTATATASSTGGSWSNSDTGSDPGRGSSDDGTWGTFSNPGASTTANAVELNLTALDLSTAELTFTITNNNALDWNINNFHMDAVAFRPGAPRDYALEVLSGSITNAVVFTSGVDAITSLGGGSGLTSNDNHDDIDLSFAGLADRTLANGESAVIQIRFFGGTDQGGGHHLFLDNVGFSGAVVPEPSTYALLGGLFALSFVAMRRRK